MAIEGANDSSSGTERWNQFELQGVIRRDALGTTRRALDLKTGSKVDLRILPEWADRAETESFIERLKVLTHPALIPTLDFLIDETNSAVVLESSDGETIPQRRSRRPRRHFEISEVKPWLRTAVDLVTYLHRENLPHGALNLGSFLIESGSVRVADLAVSRLLRPQPHFEGGAFLTLAVMSPQMMVGAPPSKADDIYALAALAYDLLTGSAVFHSGDIASQVSNSIPPTVQERRSQMEVSAAAIPQEWEDWLAKALSKDAAQRPPLETLAALVRPGAPVSRPGVAFSLPAAKSAPEVHEDPGSSITVAEFPKPQPVNYRIIGLAAAACLAVFLGFYFLKTRPRHIFEQKMNEDFAATADFDRKNPADHQKVLARWDEFSAKWNTEVQTRYPVFQPVLTAADQQRTAREDRQKQQAEEVAKKLSDHVTRGRAEFVSAQAATAANGANNPTAAIQVWEKFLADYDKPFDGGTVPVALTTELSNARATLNQLKSTLEAAQKQQKESVAAAAVDLEKLQPILNDPSISAADKATQAETLLAKLPPTPGDASSDPKLVEMRQEITNLLPGLKEAAVNETPTVPLDLKTLFEASPYKDFSENGQRQILKSAQTTLKELKLYPGVPDGDPGKGTHEAIIAYQKSKNLVPTAALDEATLTSLGMATFTDTFAALEDDDEAPARRKRRSPTQKPEKNFFQKTGDTAKKVGRSIGNIFK